MWKRTGQHCLFGQHGLDPDQYFYETETSWINILVMGPVLLLVGEVTPKTVAVTYPLMGSTNISSRLLPYWIAFIAPVREAVRYVSDRITTAIVGEPVKKDNILHADEFRTLVEEGAAHGVLRATERILIDNMLDVQYRVIISQKEAILCSLPGRL